MPALPDWVVLVTPRIIRTSFSETDTLLLLSDPCLAWATNAVTCAAQMGCYHGGIP